MDSFLLKLVMQLFFSCVIFFYLALGSVDKGIPAMFYMHAAAASHQYATDTTTHTKHFFTQTTQVFQLVYRKIPLPLQPQDLLNMLTTAPTSLLS